MLPVDGCHRRVEVRPTQRPTAGRMIVELRRVLPVGAEPEDADEVAPGGSAPLHERHRGRR